MRESRLLIRAYRGGVVHRRSDDARLELVEGKRDVAEEGTKHRRPVAAADEIGLADEEVDADGLLVEPERSRVLGRVTDPVVLEHAHRPRVHVGHIAVSRFAVERDTVFLDFGLGIRQANALIPPATHVRPETPPADTAQVLLAQWRRGGRGGVRRSAGPRTGRGPRVR